MSFWRAAYDAHAPAVLAFVSSRFGAGASRPEAEDVLHETFVRAMRSETVEIADVRAYLLRTARNLVLNRLRRPRLVVSAAEPADGSAPLSDVPASGASPEERTAHRAFARDLERALDGLSDAHRRAFRLAVLEDRSYDEIRRETGWSLAQVKVNVYRARKKVVAELRDYRAPHEGGPS